MAIDWRAGMFRTYELVRLDPSTFAELEVIQELRECTITYESTGLRYSASLAPYVELSDGYYRVYMVCEQRGRKGVESERVALATLRVQSPKWTTDGRSRKWAATGYSPLVDLDNDRPPIGWTAQGNAVSVARSIVEGHCPAPCSSAPSSASIAAWTPDDDATWLDALEAVLAKASMHVEVDGMGRVLFVPDLDRAAMQPVWTFDDAAYGLPSILAPNAGESTDFYELANKVEVVYSDSGKCFVGTAVNDDPDSPSSTVSRGYVKLLRDTSPDIDEPATQAKVDAYATKLLSEQMHAKRTATFSHAYVPEAMTGRCVRLDYTKLGYRADGINMKSVLKCTARGLVDTTIEYEEAVYA